MKKIKTFKYLSPLDWLELAKSKEKISNLAGIYNNNNDLVALDGHRLHLVKNAGNPGKFYLSPDMKDFQFPEYEILLNTKAEQCNNYLRFNLLLDQSLFKKIEIMRDLARLKDKNCLAYLHYCEAFNYVSLVCENKPDDIIFFSLKIPLNLDFKPLKEFKLGINLQYFLDALSGLMVDAEEIDIMVYDSQIFISSRNQALKDRIALIMAMRLPE